MKHIFKIGETYEVLNNKEAMSWSNTLRCISRTENTITFEELNEQDDVVEVHECEIKEKFSTLYDSTEYVDIAEDCTTQAF